MSSSLNSPAIIAVLSPARVTFQESVDIAINWSEENGICINYDKTKRC